MPTDTYTSNDSWTVPTGLTEIEVTLWGAPGSSGSTENVNGGESSPGGSGYKIAGTLPVSGGDTLYFRFGGRGYGSGDSWETYGIRREVDGGNGGEAADIRKNGTSLSDRVVVAGGGGGGAADEGTNTQGIGGDAGLSNGQHGRNARYPGQEHAQSGGGGSQFSGGEGGVGNSSAAGSAGSGGGGLSFESRTGPGGGGGGYYGGGGGVSNDNDTGAGGGGSSYTGGLSSTTTTTKQSSTGAKIEVTYTLPPQKVTDLTTTVVDGDTIDLSWAFGTNADSYNVYRSESTGVTKSDTQVASGLNSGSYTDTGLFDGTQYHYVVAGVNNAGEGELSNEVDVLTPLPAPTDLTVTDVRDDAADVRFEDGSNNKQRYRAFAGPVSTFETQRDFDAWTIQSGLQRVSDRAYKGSWSAYAYEGSSINESQPRASRVYHDGGEQIAAFEYYWQETSNSFGGGVRLKNSNGDYELGVAADNPEWDIDSASGVTVNFGDAANFDQGYDKWVRFLVTFDWDAGTFTFTGEDLDNAFTKIETFDLKEGVDVEAVELWNYHQENWGGGALDMWWDHITTYTQNGGDLTPNEDSFETLRGWDVTYGSQVSDRVYDGSFSFFSGADGTGEQARYTIAEEGEQLSKVTYYWQETPNSTGSGVRFVNSNSDYELGVTSDNPEWDVDDANGPGQVYDANDGYNHWVRFTVEFDWPNDRFSVDFESFASGETYSGVFDLKQGVDIARIELWNYNSGWGKSALQAWWDAFEFYDASGERLQPVHYTLTDLRNGEAYVTRASVFTEDTEVFDN